MVKIMGGDYRARPARNFAWGMQTQAPPQQLLPHNLGINLPAIRHFSSSVKNAYCSEELNGLLYYQNSNFLSASGGEAPGTPDQGLCPWTPLGALPPDLRYMLEPCAPCSLCRPPLFRINRRHW